MNDSWFKYPQAIINKIITSIYYCNILPVILQYSTIAELWTACHLIIGMQIQVTLFSCNTLTKCLHLLCFLRHSTEIAEAIIEHITYKTSWDVLLLSNLLSDIGGTEQVEDWNELDKTTDHTWFSDLLSDLADSVAWTEVGHDTDGAVIEATT